MPWDIEKALELTKKLMTASGGRVEPALRAAKAAGMPTAYSKQAEKFANEAAIQLKRATGQNVTKGGAQLATFFERMEDRRSAVPGAAKEGFTLTQPELPARKPWRVMYPASGRFLGEHSPYNPAYVGERLLGSDSNMFLDISSAHIDKVRNTVNAEKFLRRELRGFKNVERDQEYIKDATAAYLGYRPYLERYFDANKELEQLKAALSGEKRKLATKLPDFDAATDPQLQQVAQLTQEAAGLWGKIEQHWKPFILKWAPLSEDVRVGLLSAGKRAAPWSGPWFDELLAGIATDANKGPVAALRHVFDQAGRRGKELGLRMIEEGYSPHSVLPIHQWLDKQGKAHLIFNPQRLPTGLEWSERLPGSFMYVPSAHGAAKRYIPDAMRRLSFTPVLQKWKPILEGRISKQDPRGVEWLSKQLQGAYDAKVDTSFLDKLVWAEYADKVGLSTTANFKHLLKATELFAQMPYATLKALPHVARLAVQPFVKRFGLSDPAATKLARSFLQSRQLFRGMGGIDTGYGSRGMEVLNWILAQPIATTEALERATTVMASIIKGMDRGLSHEKIQRGILHSLLDVSFMGFVDRAPLLNHAWARLTFLFSYTPAHIIGRNIKQFLYSALPYDQRQALKYGWIKGGLLGSRRKDPLGSYYISHLARKLLVVGALEGAARAADTSVWEMTAMHIPMFHRTPAGEHELGQPPWLDVGRRATELSQAESLGDAFLDALAEHMQLLGINRIQRIWQDKIPQHYGGSAFKYLMGLPSLEAEEAMRRDPRRRRFLRSQSSRQKKAHERRMKTSIWHIFD